MGTWQGLLAEASNWQEYRGALKALREEDGPVFSELPQVSLDIARALERRGIGKIRGYSGAATFSNLTKPTDTSQPEWPKVEILVRCCPPEDAEDDSFIDVWAARYRELGGDPGPRFPPVPASEPERRNRQMMLVAAAAVIVLVAGGGLLTDRLLGDGDGDGDGDKDKTPPAAAGPSVNGGVGSSSSPSSAMTPTPSPLPGRGTQVAGNGSAEGGTGNAASITPGGNATPGAGAGGNVQNGGGVAAGGVVAPKTSPPVSKPATPSSAPPRQGSYPATFQWSDDGGGGGSASDIVNAYDVYDGRREDAKVVGSYNRNDSLVVACQVTGGRVIDVGTAYASPYTGREGVWYRMTSPKVNVWVPAVYVDTGRASLPAC
ncbi:hypothetical protein [Streptomyces sp. NPDC058674]|uniref:hypothetical protein n=1 Tax=Streptomyces sp. NPDC058674 TaxID=3346592 RepID=UPI0036624EF1